MSIDGDDIVIHLYRQPYEFIAKKWLRVRALDARTMYAEDLQSRDSVLVEGDLDHRVIRLRRVLLQAREEHRR